MRDDLIVTAQRSQLQGLDHDPEVRAKVVDCCLFACSSLRRAGLLTEFGTKQAGKGRRGKGKRKIEEVDIDNLEEENGDEDDQE